MLSLFADSDSLNTNFNFVSNETMLSRGSIRGAAKIGERLKDKDGLRFVDQAGQVFVVVQSTIAGDLGLLFDDLIFRILGWFGAADRVVATKLLVEYCETINFVQLREIVIPALENAVRVHGEQREDDLRKAKAARTIPELIAAAE